MSDLNANEASIYGIGIQTGTGLANDLMYYSSNMSDTYETVMSKNEEHHRMSICNEKKASSSTTIYIPYTNDELTKKNKVMMKKNCYNNNSSCTDDRSNESSLSTSRSRESSLSSIKTNSSHFSSLERQQVKMRNSAEKKRSKRISRAKSLNQQIRSNNKIVNIIKHDQLMTNGNYNHHATHQTKQANSSSNVYLNHIRGVKRSVSLKNNTFLLNSNLNHGKRDEFSTLTKSNNHMNKKSQQKEQQSVKYVSKVYSSSTPTHKPTLMMENSNNKQEQNENESQTRYSRIIVNSNNNQQLKSTNKLDNIKEFESPSLLSKNNDNKFNSSTSSISSTASIIANFQQNINNLSHIQIQPHQQHRQSVDATTLQLIRSNMDNNNNQLRKNSELSKSTRLIQDLAAVTWSVPNIRKQFEQQLKQQQQQQLEMQQQALYSNSSNDESNRGVVSKLGRTKTTSISSSTTTTNGNETDESQYQAYVKANQANYYHQHNRAFKDKNGNPTTYI